MTTAIKENSHYFSDQHSLYDIEKKLDAIDDKLYSIGTDISYIPDYSDTLSNIEDDVSSIKWNATD